MTNEVREYWNGQAASFDAEPDHGLLDPEVRRAWRRLLLDHLPEAPVDIVDLGCGTGTLSVLLGEEGYAVRGLDSAEQMVSAARAKAQAAGVAAVFEQGDAADPPYDAACCDVVLARHVLWALPDPARALQRWVKLLRPGGRLLLVEGRWSTGAGLTASECEALILGCRETASVLLLTAAAFWGRPIGDERYLLVSRS